VSARIVEVVYSDDAMAGQGTEDSPARTVQRLYTKAGWLIAEFDPYLNAWRGGVDGALFQVAHPDAVIR
jgi:hypothetical protein